MNELRIGNLRVKVPIIQGGMGVCVSLSGLASAVANEGGIGVISGVGIGMTEPDYRKNLREANKRALKEEIRKARLKTKGILGVNLMLAASDFEDLLEVAIKARINAVFIGAGLPIKKPSNINNSLLEHTETKFIPKVSSARAAKLIFKYWSEKYNRTPDAIVVEGPLSGGHQGFSKADLNNPEISLSTIIKDTANEIDFFEQKYGIEIPVIAAGGLADKDDVNWAIHNGAAAVMLGTRFVATRESDAHPLYKDAILAATGADTVSTTCFDGGWPNATHRVIRNRLFSSWESAGCPQPGGRPGENQLLTADSTGCEIKKYAFSNPMKGFPISDVSDWCLYAGLGCDKIDDVPSVAELIHRLWSE